MLGTLGLIGCTGGGSALPQLDRIKVHGKVKYLGKPLSTGQITFDPGAGHTPALFNIVDGSYEGLAPAGKNKVAITSMKKVSLKEKYGRDGPGYDQPVEENFLPAKYSTDSMFEREVVQPGPNEFNFDLEDK